MRLGLALTLVIPLVVTPGTIFPYVVGKALFGRVVIEITFACWVALIVCRREYRPAWSWILLAVAAWLLVSLLAGIAGVSLTRSLWSTYERMQGIVDQAHWAVFVLMAASVLRSYADWRRLFAINLGLCALVAALGLAQYYGLLNSPALASEGRVAGTLGNPTYLGAYALISALAGAGAAYHYAAAKRRTAATDGSSPAAPERRRRQRWRWTQGVGRRYRIDYRILMPALPAGLAVLLSVWAMWLSGTRGVLVGLLAGGGALALAYLLWGGGRRTRTAAGALLAALVILAVLFVLVGDFAGDAASSTPASRIVSAGVGVGAGGADDASVQGRLTAIRAGIDAWRDRPLLGWGPENFLIAWGRYVAPHPSGGQQFDQAHNKIVEVMATTGTAGLLSYLAVWAALAWVMLRAFRRAAGPDRLLLGIIGSALASYFVQHLFLFDTPGTVLLFALLAAFAVATEWRERAAPGRSLGLRWSLATPPRILRTAGAATLLLLLAALAIGIAAYVNAPAYEAAQEIRQAGTVTLPWTEQAAHYRRAAQEFPGLANYPRIYLITRASARPDNISGPILGHWAGVLQGLGEAGLASEPENWRVHAALAQFYQAAVSDDPKYLARAQQHTAAARRLAPHVPDLVELQAAQEMVEQKIAASYAVSYRDNWLTYTKQPCAAAHTEPAFMLHIFPVDGSDVPDAQAEHGYDNRDFRFAQHGTLRDGECVVQLELPEYEIHYIETGQYWPGSRDPLWQVAVYAQN